MTLQTEMKAVIRKITPGFLKRAYKNQTHRLIYSYNGDKVHCSICDAQFNQFAPFGTPKRKNAQCYNCGSLERHRLIWKYLEAKTNLLNSNKTLRLLHFAPEAFFYKKFSVHPQIEYYPCDLFPEYYNFNGGAEIKKTDITNIHFEDNYFDVILCSHVLEHIPDDRRAMSELYRVIKKGGWGILQVPIDYSREKTYEDFSLTTPQERQFAFGQTDHVRWYGKDYKDRLAEANFSVIEDDFASTFSREEIFRYGLIDSELIYYCKKD